ncbi:MAG TPA: cell envelope biogenesis protein TolA [Rhizomicrobium sp.]|nr:cell envelope biogenesis protein TolA [Rhizomicrobium sp.]
MPRKLKTFVTNLGFFELAVAAPSMKAALEAWGLGQNAFKHGFAKETGDPKIVAAAEAAPGTVLRRPIGGTGPFKQHADLPKVTTAKTAAPSPKPPKPAKRRTERKAKPQISVIDRDAARRAREKKDAKERERAEARAARERVRKERAVEKAMDALTAARERHAKIVAELERRRAALGTQEEQENERWEKERHRLEAELFKAKR